MPSREPGPTILPPDARVGTPVPQDTVAVPDPIEAGRETQIRGDVGDSVCVRILAVVWMIGIVVVGIFCGVSCA